MVKCWLHTRNTTLTPLIDVPTQAELFKKGHSRHDFSPMEISIALRTLCLDDIGRKTTPDWERALLTAKWYLEPTWKTSPFDHTVLNALWKILGEAGRADQIMALYKEAKKLRNKQFGAQIVVNVARALFAAGDHSGVVDVIEEARENGWQVELFDEVIQSQVRRHRSLGLFI